MAFEARQSEAEAASGGGGSKATGRRFGLVLAALVGLGVAGGAAWWQRGGGGAAASVEPASPLTSEPVSAPGAIARSALRIDGIAPATVQLGAVLAEGFLRAEGALSVTRKTGDNTPLQLTLTGDAATGKPAGTPFAAVELHARGAAEAIRRLGANTIDLLVLNRPLSAGEREELRLLGDLGAPADEIVVALDAVAVIVAPSNPLAQIPLARLRDVYAGKLTQWNQLPGSMLNGPIKVYASAPATAAWETFRAAAMGDVAVADSVSRIDNPEALLRTVASDPNAIGFVPLAQAHTAKVLAVADGTALAFAPNRLSIATEAYALTQRLYLYAPPHARALARRFAEFAASDAGQVLAEQAGFTGQVPAAHGPQALRLADFPSAYLQGVQGGRRLSLDLRFKPGGSELDNKALRDIERLARLVRGMPGALTLVGLVEDSGNARSDEAAAKARAETAAKALAAAGVKGVKTVALGALAPVADAPQRERNRRVEVWLGDAVPSAVPEAPPGGPLAERVPAPAAPTAPPRVAMAPRRPTPMAAAPVHPAPAERRPAPEQKPPPAAEPVETGGPSIVLKPGK